MAARLGVHRTTYSRLERGEDLNVMPDPPELGDLEPHEICYILRRRSGMTQSSCAQAIGITRYWFNLMELGRVSPEKLTTFWSKNER